MKRASIRLQHLINIESGARTEFYDSAAEFAISIGGEHIQDGQFQLNENLRIVPIEFYNGRHKGRILAGDTLVVKDGATIGKSMFVRPAPNRPMMVNEHVFVLRPRGIENRFLSYLIQSQTVQDTIWSLNIAAAQPGLSRDFAKHVSVAITQQDQQRAIADFLDVETERIDTLIDNQRRLVDLLRERRQSIITQAVTKGLDHGVAMRDSGIEWLGEIPEHWEVKRLKHLATIRVSNVDKHIVDGQPAVRLVNYTDVYYNDLITPDMQLMASTTDRDKLVKFRVLVGDTIITKDSETPDDIGVPAYVNEAQPNMVCGYHLAILRPVVGPTLPKFIFYATKSSSSAAYWSSVASGLTRYGLKVDAIGSCAVAIPPHPEQRAIADHLDVETERIDTLVSKLQCQIELLTERRQAVITAAVTGKLEIGT